MKGKLIERMTYRAGAALLAMACFGIGARTARADSLYTVTLEQVGNNVVATGSGSINLTDLSNSLGITSFAPFLNPSYAALYVGSGEGNGYTGISGPSDFGSGGANGLATGTGEVAGICGSTNCDSPYAWVVVPQGYVSGAALSGNETWDDTTLASLGVTPGTYTWTWGSGANTGSFVLDIGAPAVTPEPASLIFFGTGLLGLAALVRRRKLSAFSRQQSANG
jgi:hypothetical protein